MAPKYNVYNNNCQRFVIGLLNKICEPDRVKVITSYSAITQTKRGFDAPFVSSQTKVSKEQEFDLPPKDEALKVAESIMAEHTPTMS